MRILRRANQGSPALLPDIVEAIGLGDRFQDSVRLVGALTLRKLSGWGVPTTRRASVIEMRSRGVWVEMDVSAGEHRPLREIVARDEYGLFRGGLLRPGDNAIDIGANVGIFSLYAGRMVAPEGRVLAYEPHPAAFARLQRNVLKNGLDEIIVPANIAISDRPGELWFDPTSLSVEGRVAGGGSIAVKAIALDDDPKIAGLDAIALMKVDVEGHEAAVLAGARATLSRTRAVVVEYHSSSARTSVNELLAETGFGQPTEVVYREGLGLLASIR